MIWVSMRPPSFREIARLGALRGPSVRLTARFDFDCEPRHTIGLMRPRVASSRAHGAANRE
jgi:hypothetical protein